MAVVIDKIVNIQDIVVYGNPPPGIRKIILLPEGASLPQQIDQTTLILQKKENELLIHSHVSNEIKVNSIPITEVKAQTFLKQLTEAGGVVETDNDDLNKLLPKSALPPETKPGIGEMYLEHGENGGLKASYTVGSQVITKILDITIDPQQELTQEIINGLKSQILSEASKQGYLSQNKVLVNGIKQRFGCTQRYPTGECNYVGDVSTQQERLYQSIETLVARAASQHKKKLLY